MLRRLKTKNLGHHGWQKYSHVYTWQGKDGAIHLQMDCVTLDTQQLCGACYKMRTRGPLPVYQVPLKSADSFMIRKGKGSPTTTEIKLEPGWQAQSSNKTDLFRETCHFQHWNVLEHIYADHFVGGLH